MFSILIGLITFIFYLFYVHASQKPKRDALNNIPGPHNIPLLGAVTELKKLNAKSVFNLFAGIRLKYGTIFKLWAVNRSLVISCDVELNEQILSSNIHLTKQRNYKILHQWLGVGLLMSDGKKWYSRRKIITPTFHFKILEEFLQIFDQQSSILVQCLAERADGKTPFDIYPYICSATLDIIAETAMGTKVHAQSKQNLEYTSAVNELTTLMTWRFVALPLNSEISFSLFHPFKKLRQMKLIKILHDFTTKVIEQRRQILQKNAQNNSNVPEDQNDIGVRKRMALLDVLLQSTNNGKPLSNEDIREEVDTFMFEGHDTTTSALSFTLYLLARHTDVQNKLLQEIRQVYGDDNVMKFSLMNLNELKYMECVIKESLRLYPSVPFIGRDIKEDFKYKHSRLGEGIIPSGTELLLNIFALMKDPNYFEQPLSFKPERHAKGDINSAYTFIPFSAGPRNCIGQKFAMYEMKVILCKILLEYELLPLGEDADIVLSIVLRSETGMQLGLRKRDCK